mmetsp:Transcript_8385/g.22623  ORF Transcript_8385/g.22623 Transcript_8385/m.22623 type:complete len:247 (-) Transcript_8385:77-817(-)
MRRSLGGTRVAPPQATQPKHSPPAQKKKPAARKRDMPLAETDGQGWIKARRGPKPPTTKARKPAARKPAAKPVARRAPPHPPSSSSESDALPPRKPAARRRRPPEDFTKDLAGGDGSVSEPEEAPESDGGLDDARGKKKADASTYRFDDDDDDDDDDDEAAPPPEAKPAKGTLTPETVRAIREAKRLFDEGKIDEATFKETKAGLLNKSAPAAAEAPSLVGHAVRKKFPGSGWFDGIIESVEDGRC